MLVGFLSVLFGSLDRKTKRLFKALPQRKVVIDALKLHLIGQQANNHVQHDSYQRAQRALSFG